MTSVPRRQPARGRIPWVIQYLVLVFITLAYSAWVLTLLVLRVSRGRMTGAVRAWARALIRFTSVKVEVVGRENLPAGPCVLVANHQSLFDVPALLGYLPGHLRIVAKASLFRWPLFGWALRSAEFVPVERQNRVKAMKSMNEARERLRSGISILVFAEGTRSPTPAVQAFKKGGILLAIESGFPLVPVAIEGSWAVLPRDSFDARPGTIRLHVLPVVGLDGAGYEDRDRFTEAVREKIVRALGQSQS